MYIEWVNFSIWWLSNSVSVIPEMPWIWTLSRQFWKTLSWFCNSQCSCKRTKSCVSTSVSTYLILSGLCPLQLYEASFRPTIIKTRQYKNTDMVKYYSVYPPCRGGIYFLIYTPAGHKASSNNLLNCDAGTVRRNDLYLELGLEIHSRARTSKPDCIYIPISIIRVVI